MTNSLNELQEKILGELINEVRDNNKISIQEFSDKHFVSPAFLIKLSKKLGYSGYKELVFSLKMAEKMPKNIGFSNNIGYPYTVISNYSSELVENFGNHLKNAKPYYIYAAGQGYSSVVVEYMSKKLLPLGYRMVHTENFRELPNHKNNIAIMVSASGETASVLEAASSFHNMGNFTIAFMHNGNSRLGKLVDLPIIISKCEEEGINAFVSHAILAFEVLLCTSQKPE